MKSVFCLPAFWAPVVWGQDGLRHLRIRIEKGGKEREEEERMMILNNRH